MVCIYCSSKTQVINSRHQKRSNSIWRRRKCSHCHSTVTSIESIDFNSAIRIKDNEGNYHPFVRSNLYISIYECCKHLKNAPIIADELTNTTISKLLSTKQAAISLSMIKKTTLETLQSYNKAAGAQYAAFHC